MRTDTLVAEISGKRPGGSDKRPTEKLQISFDKVIISNNSEEYETDWPIVNVPNDYVDYYKSIAKTSDNAWYAPMNRSYAIKYAKEHGYKYLIQLDDNITFLRLEYIIKSDKGYTQRFRAGGKDTPELADDMIDTLVLVLENTNAGMAGMSLQSFLAHSDTILAERYVYSFFALDLEIVPELFQGDFEDDIEYRLKLKQMGVPVVQVYPFKYSKTGQKSEKDESGNRKAYSEVGVDRGKHMRELYGDIYSCGMTHRAHNTSILKSENEVYFKHKVKPFKVGILVKNEDAINDRMKYLFKKYQKSWETSCKMKTKKVKLSGNKTG